MNQKVTIYHNPRCSKSRQTLELLQEKGIEPVIVEYLKAPLSQATLRRLVKLLGIDATDLVRKKEKLYKEVHSGSELTNTEAIRLMAEHPKLMERPVVATEDAAVIGRPPSNIDNLL